MPTAQIRFAAIGQELEAPQGLADIEKVPWALLGYPDIAKSPFV